MDTPSSIMYADLKDFGHIPNREAALALLSPDAPYGGMSMRARAYNDRTFLSRDVVHALPGKIAPEQFNDLATASLALARQILSRLGGGDEACTQLERHYAGPASLAMAVALSSFSLDATLYSNARDRIACVSYSHPQTRGRLLLMLFVATGCLGDPAAAVALVDDFAQAGTIEGLCTTETTVGQGFAKAEDPHHEEVRLGLLRLVGDAVSGSVLPLSTSPRGTVIGALASEPGDINTVDVDVSRQHLRVFRDGRGTWYAQGLGSTNGTTLISGDTHKQVCVEPPRFEREEGATYPPVRIANSDTLCLGSSTRFLVMRVSS